MQVLRIEHPSDGYGLFISHVTNTREMLENDMMNIIHFKHDAFNTPQEDGLDVELDDKEWFCAYKSVDQFKEWINQEQRAFIIELGFLIYVLEVDEFQEGRDQVIFTKTSIKSKTDITSLFQ